MTINEIVQKLLEAREFYYKTDTPIMTDEEFDALEDQLYELDPNNGYFDSVGCDEKGKKIKHNIPMLSCDKVKTIEQVETWLKKIGMLEQTILIEPKVDGLSATIKYVDGKLKYIATRGKGKVGRDKSHIQQYVQGIPKELPFPNFCKGEIEVRGELHLSCDTKFPNPNNKPLRSLAGGLVNREENFEDLKYIKFIAYQLIGTKDIFESSKMQILCDLGFTRVPFDTVNTIKELSDYFEHYKNHLRDVWNFETDGLVLVVNNCRLHEEIDKKYVVSHHHHYNMALKPPAEGKQTPAIGIEWNVSRHGNVIPKGVVEPIVIGGSTIQKVALNNAENVEKLDLHKGDILFIERANDVIPFLKSVLVRGKDNPLLIPSHCPSCDSKLVREGIHIKCVNKDCPEVNIQKITYWVQTNEMDDVSEATVRTLYDHNFIKTVKDLYNLDYSLLNNVQGFGTSKIKNLKKQIDKTRTMKIDQFVSRLGILLVGEKAVKKLGINSLDDFWKFNDKSSVIGNNLIEYREENANFIKTLIDYIKIEDKTHWNTGGTVYKGYICMTGTGPKGRKELIEDIRKKGYEFVDSINKQTNILICEDVNGSSSKLQKAKKLGIQLISYEEFFK